jgi:predicted membrane protein
METQDDRNLNYQTREKDTDGFRNRMTGRVLAGLMIITVGVLWLIDKANFIDVPHWLLSWPMIILGVGLYLGVRHNFRGPAWIIMVIIGGIFLLGQFDESLDFHDYMFPIIVIAIGLVLLLRPQKKNRGRYDKDTEPVVSNM